jgi:uncharacterized glyoxalase superfamily protein PhnB
MRTVTPYLAVRGAAEAIDWYKRAFGAREVTRQLTPDGKVMHAQIRIGDSVVMLSDVFPGSVHKDPLELGSTTVALHMYSRAVDALWKRAVEAGAKVDMPLEDQFWGERYGQLRDPFGHSWSMSMGVKMSPEEMEAKRQQAMAMLAQGTHPGTQD